MTQIGNYCVSKKSLPFSFKEHAMLIGLIGHTVCMMYIVKMIQPIS